MKSKSDVISYKNNVIEIQKQQLAIEQDIFTIQQSLHMVNGIITAQKENINPKKHYLVGYKPFTDYILRACEYIMIIHLWSLIADKTNKSCTHSLQKYCMNVENHEDLVLQTILRKQYDKSKIEHEDLKIVIKDNCVSLKNYLSSIKTCVKHDKVSVYERIKRLRHERYAHFNESSYEPYIDAKAEIAIRESEKQKTDLHTTYKEVEENLMVIVKHVRTLGVAMIYTQYNIELQANNIAQYCIENSEENMP